MATQEQVTDMVREMCNPSTNYVINKMLANETVRWEPDPEVQFVWGLREISSHTIRFILYFDQEDFECDEEWFEKQDDTVKVSMCDDCVQKAANDDTSGASPTWDAAAYAENTQGYMVVTEHDYGFSTRECDTCKQPLAGNRTYGTLIPQ